MPICPVELDYCEQRECRQGYCRLSGDRVLHACDDCGELTVIRTVRICIPCISQRIPEVEK